MNTLIGVVLFALASKEIVGQDVEVFYRCKEYPGVSADWEMKLFVRSPVLGVANLDVSALDPVTNVTDPNSCSNAAVLPFINPVVEVIPEFDMLTLTININQGTQLGFPECRYLRMGEAGLVDKQFRWKFRVGTDEVHPAFRLYYEKDYNLFCDFGNATMTQTELIRGDVDVGQGTAPTLLQLTDAARIAVADSVSGNELTVVTFGTLITLKAVLVTAGVVPQSPEPYIGVSPYNCYACDNIQCTGNVIQITDSNGCTTSDSPFTVGFTGDGVTLNTGPFEMFAFSSNSGIQVSNLAFTCAFDYCVASTGQASCTDRCSAATGRRKKRDTHNLVGGTPGNLTDLERRVFAFIKGVPQQIEGSPGTPVQGKLQGKQSSAAAIKQEEEAEAIKCYESTGFIVAVCLLSAVLFLAIVTSTCLCLRLSTLRHRKESIYTSTTDVSTITGKGNSSHTYN